MPTSPPQPWSLADAFETYGVRSWGAGYFGINDKGNVTAAASMQPQKMNQCAAHRNGDRFSMNRCATMLTANRAARRERFRATCVGAKNNRHPRRQ